MRFVVSVTVVLTFFLFVFMEVSFAQGVPIKDPISVQTPDGGLPVSIGDTVPVGGTVALTPESISSLTAPVCGQVFPLAKLSIDGGVNLIPPLLADGGTSGEVNRTSITLANTDTVAAHKVSCDLQALDGGYAGCDAASGYGEILSPGDRMTFNVGAGRPIYCRSCVVGGTGLVSIGWREENCR